MNVLVQQLRRAGTAYSAGEQSLADFGRDVCALVARALSCSRVSLWHLDATVDQPTIDCVASHPNAPPPPPGAALPLLADEHANYFGVLASAGLLEATDALADERLAALRDSYLKPLDIRSLLDVGFSVNGVFFGVLRCEQTGTPRKWTVHDRVTVRRVGSVLSLMLSKAPNWADSTRRGGLTEWGDVDNADREPPKPSGDRRRG